MTRPARPVRPTRTHLADLRGASRMAFDATAGVVDVVERMHRTIQRVPLPLGRHVTERTSGITGLVYRSVRGSVNLLGRGLNATLEPLEQWLPAGESSPTRDVWVSVVNGIYGDYLAETGNPLAIDMSLRFQGVEVDPRQSGSWLTAQGRPEPSRRILLLVHGLCMSDSQWTHEGYSHGAALADAFGYTPLHLRYNSGRHIADNGRDLANLLEQLVHHWPVAVDDLTILGHSMGGLVARSACLHAQVSGRQWLQHLRHMAFLGTPHHGSPLERGGHGLDYVLDLSPYSAPIARIGRFRSAGIKDLRHGTITADPEQDQRLPRGVHCYAAAAVLGSRRSPVADRLVGDGLVPLESALGRHRVRSRSLGIPKGNQWIGFEMGHLELLHRPEVYAQLHAWLDPLVARRSGSTAGGDDAPVSA
jgi:pimeloyl-ACP methyl ester carboxylesterase